jgi:hypothetical protein
MSAKITRSLETATRVIDREKGIVEYVATTAAIDSYGEIVNPVGNDTSRFQKNSPFCDSHQTDSISRVLGKVTEVRVDGSQLIERVKFAIDVPSNTLARVAFEMTAAGYTPACSIGFFPVRTLTPQSGEVFTDRLSSFGYAKDAAVRCIYDKWIQVELSAVVVGANPDALVKARNAGILRDEHVDQFPEFRRALQSASAISPRRSYSFPETLRQSQPMNRKSFLSQFSTACEMETPAPAPAPALIASPADSPALRSAKRIMAHKPRSLAPREYAAMLMEFDPELRKFTNELVRWLPTYSTMRRISGAPVYRGLSLTSAGFGSQLLLPPGFVDAESNFLYQYAAFRHLGTKSVASEYSKVANITNLPNYTWCSPSAGAISIADDVQSNGTAILAELPILAVSGNISIQLLQDSKLDLAEFFFWSFSTANYSGIDAVAFAGQGIGGTTDAGQIGLAYDPNIVSVAAANGGTSVALLQRDDLEATIAAVTPAALQRKCSWFIHPQYLPAFQKVHSAGGAYQYALKDPGETDGENWYLLGFPVVWVAQMPTTAAPGNTVPVAVFGDGSAYSVQIRDEFTLGPSRGAPTPWQTLGVQYVGTSRVLCQTQNAASFARLTLAKQ